ncbi:hypothetical protein Tco_1505429 [Tanacetum coccineum]
MVTCYAKASLKIITQNIAAELRKCLRNLLCRASYDLKLQYELRGDDSDVIYTQLLIDYEKGFVGQGSPYSQVFSIQKGRDDKQVKTARKQAEKQGRVIKLVTLPHELGIGRRNCLFISKKLRANKRESRSIVLRFQGFNAEGKTSYGDQYLHMGNDSIMYAVRCTRPRFCGVCSNLGQSVFKNRGQSTGFAVKHFYKYLRNTKDYVFSIWRISRYRKLDVTGAVDWMKVQEADYHCDACDPIEYMALLPSEACNGISSLDRSSLLKILE